MSKRNRWVPPSAMQTPERGAAPLSTPEASEPLEGREDEEEDEEPVEGVSVAGLARAGTVVLHGEEGVIPNGKLDELLRAQSPPRSEREVRLAAARALKPDNAHWAAVWMAGRDAAVSALEAGTPIASVYALLPPEGAGCRDCWMRGRDAAMRVIQGV